MHTEMKCESGKTEGLRGKKEGWMHTGRVPILYGMQRSAGCVGKKQKAKHFPLFKSLRGIQPLARQVRKPTQLWQNMESGVPVPVIHTQLVSGLCLCWEGEMSFLGARFWQSKGKVRI